MNQQQKLEQKARLYKEKFEKLMEEKIEKRQKFLNLKNPMNSWNKFLFPTSSAMNLGNNFMGMNMINYQWNNFMFNIFPVNNQMKSNVENLIIKVMRENGRSLIVQCNSNDKFEIPIKNFLTKLGFKLEKLEDYEFHIIKENKARIDITVEENGINGKDCYILARKKLKISDENNMGQNINNNEDFKDKNESNNNLVNTPINRGNFINIFFVKTVGLRVNIMIGQDNTFKRCID